MKKIIVRTLIALAILLLIVIARLVVLMISTTQVSRGMPIKQYETEKSALLIIDVQNGTTGEVSTYKHLKEQSAELIRQINTLIDSSDRYNIPVVYINNEVSSRLINILNGSMAKGSVGARPDPRLELVSG